MEIDFQNTKQDYIKFHTQRLNINFRQKIIYLIIIFIGFLYLFNGNKKIELTTFFTLTLIFTIVAAIPLYLFPLLLIRLKVNKLISNDSRFLVPRKLSITDEGLLTQAGDWNVLRKWESIISAGTVGNFIYIKLIDRKIINISKSSFQSDADAANFLGLLRLKSINVNNVQNPSITNNSKEKTPYWLGILGIIPFVGAAIGLVLIIYGIFRYKDVWLVILGTIGIAFTITIYSIFSGMDLKMDQNMTNYFYPEIAQERLTKLVKEIEFYKLQNAKYPDSLSQLDNNPTNIHDSFLETGKVFNYHKIGNKYTLYSSGPDKKPNTNDDIYPAVKIDTTKIGLIIKKK